VALAGLALLVACSFTGTTPTPTPAGAPTPAARPTAEPPAAVATWYQSAQAEETVRIRADLTGAEADALTRAFARRYPEVEVTWQRGRDDALFQQTLREARDGSPGWDIYIGDSGPSLKTARQALRWTPPEARGVPADLIDPEGAWYAVAATYHVVQYNSEQVLQPAGLTTYEALLDPRFFGRLAIEDLSLTWLRGLIEIRGREAAIQLIKALAQQAVTFRDDQRSLVVFVTAGQQASAIDARMEAVERERRAGGKTAWVGVDPLVVQPLAMVVSAGTDRPNAARLVANFLLSPDAQVILAGGGRVPARSDVDPDPQSLIQGLHPYVVLPPEAAAERELRELWLEAWGRR
jgi:iron(III) transport system substrate-binding protein